MAIPRQLFLSSFPASTMLPSTTPCLRSARAPVLLQQLTRLALFTPLNISLATRFGVPSILAGLWESVLRAVPKKKTSHRKKRQRFLAGKALQDVTALNKCSACGNVKRSHLLCPFCVNGTSRSAYEVTRPALIDAHRNSRYVGRKDNIRRGEREG